jgi:energy-coupling factor transporter ATP-binding protein EcfA2
MLAQKIPTCATITEAREKAVKFGSAEEDPWLDKYFRVPGGPAGKPFYMPGSRDWVKEEYSGKSLQRRRKDYDGTVFHHPDAARWAFRPEAAEVIEEKVLGQKRQAKVPLVALMAWMWRTREIPSLEEGLKQFLQEFGFKRDGLTERVYDPTIPAEFKDAGLTPAALTAEDLAELLGTAVPPPPLPELAQTISTIEEVLKQAHYETPPGLVERIVGGWLVSDIVVLVGPSGSGKTALARLLAKALERLFGKERFLQAFLEVTPGYDVAQFLGYENLAGEFSQGRFAKEALFLGQPTDPRLVVMDEWNLAQIDAYFAPVLSVVESKRPMRLPGKVDLSKLDEDAKAELKRAQPLVEEGQWNLPEDTFFLGTCNGWADEPETRLPISGPVKRRCRIIAMPNVLVSKYKAKGRDGIFEVCDTLLAQERGVVEARKEAGESSVWDSYREKRLAAVRTSGDLDETTRTVLVQVVARLLDDAHTQGAFTVGILRDVLLSCVYAAPGKEVEALGQQIADKVIHQLQGDPKILEVVVTLCKDLPNSGEIRDLATKMGAFAANRRIKSVV